MSEGTLHNPDFDPASEQTSDSEIEGEFSESAEKDSSVMFVVYKAQLQKLFGICHYTGCGKPLLKTASFQVHGFPTNIETHCIEGHRFKWEAHPKIKHVVKYRAEMGDSNHLVSNTHTRSCSTYIHIRWSPTRIIMYVNTL